MTHPLLEAAESYLNDPKSQADFLEVFASSPLWLPGEFGESPVEGKTLTVLDFKQLDDGYLALTAFVEKPEISQELPQVVEVSGSYVLSIISNAKIDLLLVINGIENKSIVYVDYNKLLLWRTFFLLNSISDRSNSPSFTDLNLPNIEIFQKILVDYCTKSNNIQQCQLCWIHTPEVSLDLAAIVEGGDMALHKAKIFELARIHLPPNIYFWFNPTHIFKLESDALRNVLKDPKTFLYDKYQNQSWLGRLRRNFERVTVPVVVLDTTNLK